MNIGAIAIGSNSTRLLTRLENGLEDRARERGWLPNTAISISEPARQRS